jgi:hypothetical protein
LFSIDSDKAYFSISANKHFRGWIIVARFVKQKPSTFSKNKSLVCSIITNIAAKDFDKIQLCNIGLQI